MKERQMEFANAASLDRITEVALDTDSKETGKGLVEIAPLGQFMGREVTRQFETLNQLNNDYPSDFEILLGYPTSKNGRYLDKLGDSNPFGHIAIRIKDKVYTVNHRSKMGEGQLHEVSSLAQYLYSTKARPEIFEGYDFIGVHGQAYGRESIGIRYPGLSKSVIAEMTREFENIEKEFLSGKTGYEVKTCNCATLIRRVLAAAGLVPKEGPAGIAFPIDVFEEAVKTLAESGQKTTTIRYAPVQNEVAGQVTTNIPLTLKKPIRGMARMAKNLVFPKRIKLLAQPDAQIAFSKLDNGSLYYENLTKKNLANRCLWLYQN